MPLARDDSPNGEDFRELQEAIRQLAKVSANCKRRFAKRRKAPDVVALIFAVRTNAASDRWMNSLHPISCDPSRYKYDYIIEEDYGF